MILRVRKIAHVNSLACMPATTHPVASVSGTQCESEKLHKDSYSSTIRRSSRLKVLYKKTAPRDLEF